MGVTLRRWDLEMTGPHQEMGLKERMGLAGRRRGWTEAPLSACGWFWDGRNWECLQAGERDALVFLHKVDP